MTEELSYGSSVFVLTLDDYTLKRLFLPNCKRGDKIYIRPKEISLIGYPSCYSYRFCTASFLYRTEDGETNQLTFINRAGNKHHEMRCTISGSSVRASDVFTSVISELAYVVANGSRYKELLNRKELIIHYNKRREANNVSLPVKEIWSVRHTQTIKLFSFTDTLVVTRNEAVFDNGKEKHYIKVPYENLLWKTKACSVFCKQIKGGDFTRSVPTGK